MSNRNFIILLSIAAALRILFIWQAPLWYDENYSLLIARLPIDRMWQAILGDVHPPLWYLVIRPIAQLIPTDRLAALAWTIRIPALLFSISSVAVFRRTLVDLQLPSIVQKISLTLMAVLPFQLYYAQEGRMYAMLEFFILLAVMALLEQRAWLLTFAIAATLYSHNYGALYVAALGALSLLLFVTGKIVKPLFLNVGFGILAWLPWSLVVYQQANKLTGSYWLSDVTLGGVLKLITDLFGVSSPYLPAALALFGWGLIFLALMIGIWHILAHRPDHWLTVAMLAFAPLALAWVASAFWQPILLSRPLIGITPFLYLIAAWPLGIIDSVWARLYLAVFTVPLLVAGLIGYYVSNPLNKSHNTSDRSIMDVAVATIRAHWQPGDMLYNIEDGSMVWTALYAPDLPQAMMPPCGKILDALNPQTRAAIGPDLQDWRSLVAGGHRLWALVPYSPIAPACYDAVLAPLTKSAPVMMIDDNPIVRSGVWLVVGHSNLVPLNP